MFWIDSLCFCLCEKQVNLLWKKKSTDCLTLKLSADSSSHRLGTGPGWVYSDCLTKLFPVFGSVICLTASRSLRYLRFLSDWERVKSVIDNVLFRALHLLSETLFSGLRHPLESHYFYEFSPRDSTFDITDFFTQFE